MANADRISSLLLKHLRNELTPNEVAELAGWRNESKDNRELFDNLTSEEGLRDLLRDHYKYKNETWKKLVDKIPELGQEAGARKRRRVALFVAIAVAVFVFILRVIWKSLFR